MSDALVLYLCNLRYAPDAVHHMALHLVQLVQLVQLIHRIHLTELTHLTHLIYHLRMIGSESGGCRLLRNVVAAGCCRTEHIVQRRMLRKPGSVYARWVQHVRTWQLLFGRGRLARARRTALERKVTIEDYGSLS